MPLHCDCVAQASLVEACVSSLVVARRLSRCGTWA